MAAPRRARRAGQDAEMPAQRFSRGRSGVSGGGRLSKDLETLLVKSKPIQQVLVLDGYPTQEQQDLLGPNRGSRRWGVAEMRKHVQTWTMVAVRAQDIVPVPPPVRATYTFVVPDRGRRDWDNYALICKPVQDGLVKAGILVGDHYAVLTARVLFRVEPGQRRLEITLERAAPGDGAGE